MATAIRLTGADRQALRQAINLERRAALGFGIAVDAGVLAAVEAALTPDWELEVVVTRVGCQNSDRSAGMT